jgi:hypothetical protein
LKILGVDRDQRLEISKTKTLVGANVRKISKPGRWSVPMSFFFRFPDIGSGQCPENSKIGTLVAANV